MIYLQKKQSIQFQVQANRKIGCYSSYWWISDVICRFAIVAYDFPILTLCKVNIVILVLSSFILRESLVVVLIGHPVNEYLHPPVWACASVLFQLTMHWVNSSFRKKKKRISWVVESSISTIWKHQGRRCHDITSYHWQYSWCSSAGTPLLPVFWWKLMYTVWSGSSWRVRDTRSMVDQHNVLCYKKDMQSICYLTCIKRFMYSL